MSEVIRAKKISRSGKKELYKIINKYFTVYLVTALALLVAVQHVQALEWSTETVDSVGNVGEYTSIALGSSGNPHISYCHVKPQLSDRVEIA
jgi:hypothetical protein